MNTLDQASKTQYTNILAQINLSIEEVRQIMAHSGLEKHSELRQLFIDQLGLTYGNANALVAFARMSDAQLAGEITTNLDEVLAAIYTKTKAPLLPLHQAVMEKIHQLGAFEISPKKTYLSLRRKKQFAMVGPASKGRLEVGLNSKHLIGSQRLTEQKPGGMCQFKVYLTTPEEIDAELLGWVQAAFDEAG